MTTSSRDFEMFDFDDDGDLDLFVQPMDKLPIHKFFEIYLHK